MPLIPAQTPPIARDSWGRTPDDSTQEVAALATQRGVEASQTVCDNLRGPAQSLCYAAMYGVSV